MSIPSANAESAIESIWAHYGREERVSDWFAVEQTDMNLFAEATHDPDWMHIDPERAKNESPFGKTVAFGFWTMSIITHLSKQAYGNSLPDGFTTAINYGFDRVRLMSPVPIGSRIRVRCRVVDVESKGDGRYVTKTEVIVEIENEPKPAMTAEWLSMIL